MVVETKTVPVVMVIILVVVETTDALRRGGSGSTWSTVTGTGML